MKKSPRLFLSSVCLLLASAIIFSCGRKTQPLTPDSPRPGEVTDIKAAVRDDKAFLSWRVPGTNIEGKAVSPSDIAAFQVYRAELDHGRKRPRYRMIADIRMSGPAPAEVKNGLVFWNDDGLKYGQSYVYRVRALSSKGGIGPFSAEARVVPLLSLAAPKNVVAQAGDGLITLGWNAVTTKADGSRHDGFIGYNVYRGAEAGRYGENPVNKEPVRTNSYKDSSAVNDTTYYYIIRSVDSPAPPWRESLNSEEASAAPKDMTPPERPEGLTVVPGVGRIFLTWNESKERDLGGYHVYRSLRSGKDYERLTEKPIIRTTFSDEAVKHGTTYYYIITALDAAGNEGPPSREQKAFAERLR